MDLLHFLRDRLRFIRYFYDVGNEAFHDTMRKIEAGEEPYVDRRDPEYADEPAFLSEWTDADAATTVIGMTSLGMLQAAFHDFLEQYLTEIERRSGKDLLRLVSTMKKGSWFQNYRSLFETELGIDWVASGVDLEFLEQVVLTRHDFEHNVSIVALSANVFQSKYHAKKYPDTAFRDPSWPVSIFLQPRLKVTKEKFEEAVEAVERLCEYLEGR